MRLPVLILSAVVGAVAFALGNYHYSEALDNRTEQARQSLWSATSWGMLFSPQNFTPKGLRHRNRSIVYGLLFLSSGITLIILLVGYASA